MRAKYIYMASLLLLTAACSDNGEPGIPSSQPEYRTLEPGQCSSGERGNMMINEVHFAGSVKNDGTYDADDVFIELWNRHPRPINVSNWRLNIWGETEGYTPDQGFLIPVNDKPIPPNGYFVIAKKDDGAFADIADVFMPGIDIGKRHFKIELRDCDQKLMEDAGSRDVEVFSGGYDLYSARSMERVQLIFQNRGSQSISWHAFSSNVGDSTVHEDYRQRTFASPRRANSTDYSGGQSSGVTD